MEKNPYRQAAIVIASLTRESADAVLDRLPEAHARAVRDELVRIDVVEPNEQESAIGEIVSMRQACQDSYDSEPSREIEDADVTCHEPPPRAVGGSFLDDLLVQDDTSIACALVHERTSVVAALLGAVPGKRAASILRQFPDDLQARVVTALNFRAAANQLAVEVVADRLCDRHAEFVGAQRLGLQHNDALQAIFDELTEEERAEMLRGIEKENPMLAQRLIASSSDSPNDCYC